LIFTTDAYVLSSPTGSDTISTPSVQVDAPTATISGKITGSNALTKSGTGTLVLSGANDFVGSVIVSAGTLQVSSDGNLGATTNAIALSGGTFNPTTSISLNASRNLSGTGTIKVGSGDTLTVNGTTNAGTVTLSDTGTVVLAGASNTLSGVAMSASGMLSVTGSALTLNGDITTTNTTGTATISAPSGIAFGSTARTITVADGSASSDLLIAANITSSGTARLQKRGAGTLELTGDNTGLVGIQLGSQGTTPLDGGRIIAAGTSSLGNPANQLQANYGTLQASSTISSTGGLSIGGRSTGYVTFAGSNMAFGGTTSSNSFFKATGTTGELRFNVNNTTTLGGTFVATSGSGTATGITVGGTGMLVIAGDASAITEKWTTLDSLTLSLTSAGKIGAGGIGLASDTTLKLDIDSVSLFGSSTGALAGSGGAIIFNVNTTGYHTWSLFSGGSGTASTVAISGTGYGSVSLSDPNADQIWTGSSGSTTFAFNLLTGSLVVVPEPGEYAFAIVGLLGAVVVLRRRKAAQA
jgi:autotransporter-associated beta strand protein